MADTSNRGRHFNQPAAADETAKAGRHAAGSHAAAPGAHAAGSASGKRFSKAASSSSADVTQTSGSRFSRADSTAPAGSHSAGAHVVGSHAAGGSRFAGADQTQVSPAANQTVGFTSASPMNSHTGYAAPTTASARRAKKVNYGAADNPYSADAYAGGGDGGNGGRGGKHGRTSNGGEKPKRKNVLSTLLIVVGVVLLLVAAGMFINTQLQYAATDSNNEKLAAYATVSDEAATGCPITVDWESLKAVNDDVVGWIYIPDTNVNFPVYQGESNDTYLRTSATGEWSVGGQIFMDYENAAPGMVDRQTIIYGHHLNNGAMFAQIDEYANESGMDKFQTIWYLTEDATYELTGLLFYKSAATNADARAMTWASDDEFHSYLNGLVEQASATNETATSSINNLSKVLTLCTCDYENDFGQSNGRGLLVCALKSEVEAGANGATTSTEEPAATDTTEDTQAS